METTSVQLSKIIKKLNRASLEYVLFETLLREAAEQGETPILERVNKILPVGVQQILRRLSWMRDRTLLPPYLLNRLWVPVVL